MWNLRKENKKMEKDQIKSELNKLKSLQDVSHLEGVQLLVERSRRIIINSVDALASSYTDKSEQELRVICATLKANLEIYQLMTGLDSQIEAIEEALKDVDNKA